MSRITRFRFSSLVPTGVALAVLMAVAPTQAQQGPMPTRLSSPSTPASHRAAAQELLRLTTTEDHIDTIVQTMVDALVNAMPPLGGHRPEIIEFFRRHFTVEEMVRRLTPHYVATLNELELRRMAWFYRTPAGTRMLAVMPELTKQGAEIGQAIVQEHSAELQELVRSIQSQP
ncbi:MAG: DUF2059 domain-containing protein [Sandaracinaceae bacterium]